MKNKHTAKIMCLTALIITLCERWTYRVAALAQYIIEHQKTVLFCVHLILRRKFAVFFSFFFSMLVCVNVCEFPTITYSNINDKSICINLLGFHEHRSSTLSQPLSFISFFNRSHILIKKKIRKQEPYSNEFSDRIFRLDVVSRLEYISGKIAVNYTE